MAIEFRCLSCSHKLSVKDEYAGKSAVCPNCEKPITVPAESTEPSSKTSPGDVQPAAPRQEVSAQASSWSAVDSLLLFIALVFCIAGVVTVVNMIGPQSYRDQPRFLTDNAYGATANALERIAQKDPPSYPALWFICSLLCWAILSIRGVRRSIEAASASQRGPH